MFGDHKTKMGFAIIGERNANIVTWRQQTWIEKLKYINI
jgi:hypothetical protein